MARKSRGRGKSSRDFLRARVLEQWRGIGPPLDPEKNVSKAGDLLSGILAKLQLEDDLLI